MPTDPAELRRELSDARDALTRAVAHLTDEVEPEPDANLTQRVTALYWALRANGLALNDATPLQQIRETVHVVTGASPTLVQKTFKRLREAEMDELAGGHGER